MVSYALSNLSNKPIIAFSSYFMSASIVSRKLFDSGIFLVLALFVAYFSVLTSAASATTYLGGGEETIYSIISFLSELADWTYVSAKSSAEAENG